MNSPNGNPSSLREKLLASNCSLPRLTPRHAIRIFDWRVIHYRGLSTFWIAILAIWLTPGIALTQPYGSADSDQPGDRMIQSFLKEQATTMHTSFMEGIRSKSDWNARKPGFMDEYFHMLGLWPLPKRTPLNATITGTLHGNGYVVENLHYQSRPGLYVTGNLYRPAEIQEGEQLPAIFYVCGHSSRGRNGNKTAYQSHGIWFARHGYVCLVVDTLQLGEIAALHHGTYREKRWWWHSRGYTPAGVECWNGIRGIDYLLSRTDVDPDRIGVTGISGGGAATFWIAAGDERVKASVPVSGMADLSSYIPNRVVNGHCDCMFLYNTFQWPWTRIAALVAPRPLLFVNSDNDSIFPMDANQRDINRLESLYSLFGAGDQVDSVVSIGGHAYREDIRRSVYRFMNIHLKNDPSLIVDSEVDLVTGDRNNWTHPISPEQLRVFPKDSDIPKDQLNTSIDRHFVSMAEVNAPKAGRFESWKRAIESELRRVTFRSFPERIPAAKEITKDESGVVPLETEPGIRLELITADRTSEEQKPTRILLIVRTKSSSRELGGRTARKSGDRVYVCEPRGVGKSRWTLRNPPNYVARSHVLLGRTVDDGRVWDIAATARYLFEKHNGTVPVHVVGQGAAAVLATYAMLLEPSVAGAYLEKPTLSHMNADCPQFLNVLRVCDVPDVLGLLAPRSLTIRGVTEKLRDRVQKIYAAAEASKNLKIEVTN